MPIEEKKNRPHMISLRIEVGDSDGDGETDVYVQLVVFGAHVIDDSKPINVGAALAVIMPIISRIRRLFG